MRLHVLLLIIFISIKSVAQTIDYQQVIAPKGYRGDNIVEEKLVRLAWENHPVNEIYRTQVNLAEKNVMLSKWSWLTNVKASYNLNEFTINPNAGQTDTGAEGRLIAYPRYNIGIGISLGDILTTPTNVYVAKEEYKIAEHTLNAHKLQVRMEVLERYYQYQLASQLMQIRSEENEEAYANFLLMSEKFKNGEVTLDEYNKMATVYNTARATLAQQDAQLKIEKTKLEALIGVKLETVID